MFLTGFADEAADGIAAQIAITKKLGWSEIELRAVNGTNWHDLSDEDFEKTREALEKAGIKTTAMGSNIANWGHDWNEDFDAVLATVERAVGRMKALGGRFVRIMSWKVLYEPDGRAKNDQKAEERIGRLKHIVRLFREAEITPVHENCATWGGMSPEHTLKMIREVPGLKLVFDTGNPPVTADFNKDFPYPMQSSLAFYEKVKDHIAHIHIKDSCYVQEIKGEEYHWPGEGGGEVGLILTDLAARGYNGGFSIEPHMKVVYHDASVAADADARAANYIEYGQRLMGMLKESGYSLST